MPRWSEIKKKKAGRVVPPEPCLVTLRDKRDEATVSTARCFDDLPLSQSSAAHHCSKLLLLVPLPACSKLGSDPTFLSSKSSFHSKASLSRHGDDDQDLHRVSYKLFFSISQSGHQLSVLNQ